MHCRRLAVLLVAAAGAAAQTEPAAEPPAKPLPPAEVRLLVRQYLVSPSTLQAAGSLAVSGYVGEARWLYGNVHVLEGSTVDAGTGEMLDTPSGRLRLRTANGAWRWAVAADAVGADVAGAAERRLLFADRVVVPRAGGGLLGLDRRTGVVVWQRADVPDSLLVADGTCLAAAGTVNGSPMLAVLAVANGAASCRVTLPDNPVQVLPGPHGIAVRMRARLAVFDRTGPQLFDRPGTCTEVVSGPDGWFVRDGGTVESVSRTGSRRWQVEAGAQHFEDQFLLATAAGDVLVVTWRPMADSGVRVCCRAAADGAVHWTLTDQGLGVAHSKYWHRVQARSIGDRVYVTSQAAGGNFALRFDPIDGSDVVREKFAW